MVSLVSALCLLLLRLHSGVLGDDSSQVCVNDGICVKPDVVIPKAANLDGAAPALVKDCIDKHPNCAIYERQDQCVENPGWMIVNCPFSCKACHLRNRNVRCSKDFLNMTNDVAAFVQPGDISRMFESILDRFSSTYKIEVLSRDPWIITFDDILSHQETDAFVATVNAWERSTDTGSMNEHGETGRKLSTSRTSSNAWCRADCEANPHVQNVIHRIEDITNIPYDNSESFQILRYEPGQKYSAHHDSSDAQYSLPCGPRVLTFFLYLSDVDEGGETNFPNLNVAVKPKRGKAVLWPSVKDSDPGQIDWRTRHEAKPVISGTKYGANSWIHMNNFRIPNLWGCTGSFD
jgi:prolyl 4-hydroxylase